MFLFCFRLGEPEPSISSRVISEKYLSPGAGKAVPGVTVLLESL